MLPDQIIVIGPSNHEVLHLSEPLYRTTLVAQGRLPFESLDPSRQVAYYM